MSEDLTDLEPTIEVRRLHPDTVVVVVEGEHDLSTANELQDALTESLGTCSHLIVDLSAARFIDSSTIAVLVGTKKRADTGGQRFNLVLASSPIVERVLEMTRVLPGLNRVKSLEEALAA
jgi:anti-sigma B factor antagonist